jgi:tetratricopeptide (TPR) repeat protein
MRSHAAHRLLLAALGVLCLAAHTGERARGDAAWESRARGQKEGLARPGPILEALAHYERALAAHPEDLETRWKLLRALHFAGDFSERDETARRELFDRAVEVSERGLDRLARRLGSERRLEERDPSRVAELLAGSDVSSRDVARLYFWSAIGWGAWSRNVGLLAAVRQGVANRLHRYTLLSLALEPGYEDGGALRLLGSLHAELPRVPFVSGWVDRERAVPLLERAYALAPEHPGNRLLLALTLLDLAPQRRDEAMALLGQVAELEPRPDARVEDLALRAQAREVRSEVRAGAEPS